IAGLNSDGTLAPLFFARGKKPQSELAAFNPWERRPADQVNPVEQRLYYVDKNGLHTIAAPEGYHYSGLLQPTRQELEQGRARVLLFRGTEYVLDFFVAPLNGKQIGTPSQLSFSIYQRLTGLSSTAVTSAGADGTVGSLFYEQGTTGRMRLSVLGAGTNDRTL